MLLHDARQSHIWDLPYLGRPCAREGRCSVFMRSGRIKKKYKDLSYSVSCSVFVCLPNPKGSYIGVRSITASLL